MAYEEFAKEIGPEVTALAEELTLEEASGNLTQALGVVALHTELYPSDVIKLLAPTIKGLDSYWPVDAVSEQATAKVDSYLATKEEACQPTS